MLAPDFIGTLPGWITAASTTTGVVTLTVAFWRRGVSLKGLQNADQADKRNHLAEEMKALRENVASLRAEVAAARKELADCEEECRTKLDAMREELWGEKRQRVAEQIAFINMILKTVDAPELKTLLTSLETVQRHISAKMPDA